MSNSRKSLSQKLLDELYFSQDNHCATCLSRDQLDAHHIIPVKDGGLNIFDNLILLCKTCHATSDSGAIPPSILKYFKYTCKADPITSPRDSIGIYMYFATSIIKDLTYEYDTDKIDTARNVIEHLMRSRDPQYRFICLNLMNSILFANRHSEIFTPSPIILAKRLLEITDKDSNEIFLRKQIFHNIGILHHINKDYTDALTMYSKALDIRPRISNTDLSNLIKPENFMTEVHMTSTLYMKNQVKDSFYKIERILSSQDLFSEKIMYDPHAFAIIRLAEHYISQNKLTRSKEELKKLLHSKKLDIINPIYKVIMYKDLARVHLINGDREEGKYYLITALTLAKQFKYYNQIIKIKSMKEIKEKNINIEELYNKLGY